MTTKAPTARERARAEITAEILTVARRHLAEGGAASLSLRAVAREVGMVSSAVYRSFPSRDELLTRLIVDAYTAVADAAEAADAAVDRGDLVGRIVGAATAIRRWAVANPHEYALVYGTPVPGYAAPQDTVDPALRVTLVFTSVLVDGVAAGDVAAEDASRRHASARTSRTSGRSRGSSRWGPLTGLILLTQLFGHISYELFGHLHNGITDYDGFFDLQVRRLAAYVIDGPAPDRF